MLVESAFDGGQGPPLLYVPGIDGTGEHLLGTRARLEERFRVVALRYVGSPASVEHGHEELARAIAAHAASLGLGRFLVLAESFGVAVALRLALEAPGQVRGLALVNGFAHYPARLSLALSRLGAPLVPRGLFRRTRPLTAWRALFAPRRDPSALRALLALEGAWFDRDYRRRLAMIARVDLRPRLGEIEVPVRIYASTHDRIVPSLRTAREMVARLPRAEVVSLPRAGHLVLPLAEEPWVERLAALDLAAP